MNTPAHLVVNLALLGAGDRRPHAAPIALGALLPDLPMFFFFGWERIVLQAPTHTIWGEHYFAADWQACFDLFNSIPLFALGLVVALWLRSRATALVCASVLLHCMLDLPVHREDGHRHFFPLSDWRFMSPVSYWDPAHGGALGAGLETLALVAASVVLWKRYPQLVARAPLAVLGVFAMAVWLVFYGLGRMPDF